MHLEAVCCKCKESFPSCDIIAHEENCSINKAESNASVGFKGEDADSCSPFNGDETLIMKDEEEDICEYDGRKLPDFNSDQKFYQKFLNVNFEKLLKIWESKTATFNFLLEVGHIGPSSICSCGHFMVLEKDKKLPLGHRLRCHKCRNSQGILQDTIYQNNKIGVEKVVKLIYFFFQGYNRKKKFSITQKLDKDKRLSKLFVNKLINHSKCFVDQSDKAIHTQTVERLWHSIKEFKKSGTPEKVESLQEKICEMIIRIKYQLNLKNAFAFFMYILISFF